jgi:hypothetical protein
MALRGGRCEEMALRGGGDLKMGGKEREEKKFNFKFNLLVNFSSSLDFPYTRRGKKVMT